MSTKWYKHLNPQLIMAVVFAGVFSACGGTSDPNPGVPVPPPGGVQPAPISPVIPTNACIPVQPGAPVNFTGQGLYVDSVNVIGGKIPAISGLFGGVNQDIGVITTGGLEVPAIPSPNVAIGNSPDGILSVSVAFNNNPYAGSAYPSPWYQAGGSVNFFNPGYSQNPYQGLNQNFFLPQSSGSVTGTLSGTLRLSELVVQDIIHQRQIRGRDTNTCVAAIGLDMGRLSAMGGVGYGVQYPYQTQIGMGGERLFAGRVYLWLNDMSPGGNYILYF